MKTINIEKIVTAVAVVIVTLGVAAVIALHYGFNFMHLVVK